MHLSLLIIHFTVQCEDSHAKDSQTLVLVIPKWDLVQPSYQLLGLIEFTEYKEKHLVIDDGCRGGYFRETLWLIGQDLLEGEHEC